MKSKRPVTYLVNVCLVILLLSVAFLAACSNPEPTAPSTPSTPSTPAPSVEKLNIGALICLTGWISGLDIQNLKEAEIFVDMINEKGGVAIGGTTYEIKLLAEDCQSTLEGVATACNRLVHDQKVKFIVGPTAFFSIAVSPIADPNEVLHVLGHCSGLPGEMGADVPYGFLADGGIPAHFNGVMDFFKTEYPNVKTVGVIVPAGAVSDPMRDGMVQAFKDFNLQQAGDWVEYSDDVVDFTPYASKLNALKPDAVFIPAGTIDHLKNIAKGLRALGYEGPIGGDVYANAGAFIDFLGEDAANDIYYRTFSVDHPDNSPILNELLHRIHEQEGDDVLLSLEVANSLYVLLNMMQLAESTDPKVVKEVWENTDEIETLNGTGLIGSDEYYGIKHHAVNMKITFERLINGKTEFGWYGGQPIP